MLRTLPDEGYRCFRSDAAWGRFRHVMVLPHEPCDVPPTLRTSMPRRTSLHLITPALLVLAFGLAVGPAAAAVQGIAAPVAQSTPKQSDLKKAEQQVAAAQKRLDTAERALQQAADLRKSIRDRIEQGQEEVKLTTAQQAV